MGTITLEDMQFYAFHGCYTLEQRVGNRFRVDLEFSCDTSKAEMSDNIEDTISYLDVYDEVRLQMQETSHILEHVCRRIIDSLRVRFPDILSIEVRVTKLSPPLGGDLSGVSVSLSE